MPIHRDFENILNRLGFVSGWYFPKEDGPHLHLTLDTPQTSEGRVVSITGTGSDGRQTHYMRNGVLVGTLAELDDAGAGWGQKAADVLWVLEVLPALES